MDHRRRSRTEVAKLFRGSLPFLRMLLERCEAERRDEVKAPLLVNGLVAAIDGQGFILRRLAEDDRTAAELDAALKHAVERLPAVVEQRVYDTPLSFGAFVRALAELLALHREAVERVVAEQVEDPGEIEALLALAPVPVPGDDAGENPDVAAAVFDAILAHARALELIAADL